MIGLTVIGNVQYAIVRALLNHEDVVSCGELSMTLSSVKMFLLNLGVTLGARFVVSLFQDLEHVNPVQYNKINRSRGNMFDEIFHGIFTLSLERGLYSQATFSQMRPCQSHAIVILRSFEFL